MSSGVVRSIAVPVTVTAGALTECLNLHPVKTVQVSGTFTATLQFQGTLDNVGWFSVGGEITAPGGFAVSSPLVAIRCNTTAYTSGTPVATLAGVYLS